MVSCIVCGSETFSAREICVKCLRAEFEADKADAEEELELV